MGVATMANRNMLFVRLEGHTTQSKLTKASFSQNWTDYLQLQLPQV